MIPMVSTDLVTAINHSLALQLPEDIALEELYNKLSAHINALIKNNFEVLVALLYKIDVNEDKLKLHLIDNPNEDAGNVIAALIIERFQQKASAKKQFTPKPPADDNEEKW
jgi:hypothetical protein